MLCRNQCNLKYFQRLVSPFSSFRGYHSRQGVYGFKPQIHASHTNNNAGAFVLNVKSHCYITYSTFYLLRR